MKLKWLTNGLLLFGVGLLLGWPWIVGARPPSADKTATAQYALRFGIYVILLMVVFGATTISAWMLARRQRQMFREQELANLKDLVEGALRDHGREKS